ncbi:tetratricopeptide repeat protein [Bacillus sp. DX1.1]|uniref:tetratricopeptide repeat protein n=1 Tax=unclassified Bacillus (in: firmicutes) TaxID=185979 RepID=UPI00257080DF|nr:MULTISPECIES: tetratricopeptide repeat protein [unclassified Bacillus (in: firmicutes)]MDM5155265.1 tetratricopeptide repeat protein [Bacillus sp. DX1.1]WJE79585.1 tetratricopeptide repeat protein [Bacillus sp. DX3.1]
MKQLLQQAIDLRNEKKYEESRNILIELLNLTKDAEVLYQCAWTHDAMGLETEAAPYYEQAIVNGLAGEDLRGAYIGLGSTYRCIGEYNKSIITLEAGLQRFPDDDAMKVFLSLAKYNVKEYEEAMKLLIDTAVKLETVKEYERAILFYKDHLNKTFK